MSTPSADPYQVLGVAKDASLATVRAAHRKLVLKTHPDKVQDESERAKKLDEFQRIQEAYEILSDGNRRREYDDQVKFAEAARRGSADRFRPTVFRYEVRTAAPPGDFDRVYEHRKASRSFEDDLYYKTYEDRSAPRKTSSPTYRKASRGTEERKSSRAESKNERPRADRERVRSGEKENYSDRRRTRDRERQRDYDDKYFRGGYDDDDSDRFRDDIFTSEKPRRRSDPSRRERVVSDSIRKERNYDDALAYMHESRGFGEEELAFRPARFNRSATDYFDVRVSPTSPSEDTVRRSRARASNREREKDRPRTSRKESLRDVEVIEPEYEVRSPRSKPAFQKSASSPTTIRVPRSPREFATPPRTSTMHEMHSSPRDTPPLSRASTMPVNETGSRRRDYTPAGSSKLKASVEVPIDSGYSSPSTTDTPHVTATASPGSPPRRRQPEIVLVEEGDSEDEPTNIRFAEPGHQGRYRSDSDGYESRERDVSPHTRPSPTREDSSTFRRSKKQSYSMEPEPPSSRSSRAPPPPPLLRKDSPAATRASPPFVRAESSSKSRSSPRRLHGDVHYSPRISPDDIRYTHSPRRGSGSEGVYRDAAPYGSRSHYAHHPGILRAETSTY